MIDMFSSEEISPIADKIIIFPIFFLNLTVNRDKKAVTTHCNIMLYIVLSICNIMLYIVLSICNIRFSIPLQLSVYFNRRSTIIVIREPK